MRNSSQPKIQQYQKHGIEVPASESLGTRYPRDIAVWDKLESLINTNEHSHKHVLELFPAYIRRIHLGRFLAHYELFKLITDIPGCIVEAGVYRGSSLLTFSKLMEIFSPGDRTRRVFGFDNFKGLGKFHKKDGKEDPASGKGKGGWSAKNVQAEVEELINICNQDNFISGHERVRLVVGDLADTLPAFIKDNPGLRISLLHIDVDMYEATKVTLEHLFPLVVPGGLVVFDEYGMIPWAGETEAADEYFKKVNYKPKYKKFHFSQNPHGYFIK